MTGTTERIVLVSRPVGEPMVDNFRQEELPIPQPGPGQMMLRTLRAVSRDLEMCVYF